MSVNFIIQNFALQNYSSSDEIFYMRTKLLLRPVYQQIPYIFIVYIGGIYFQLLHSQTHCKREIFKRNGATKNPCTVNNLTFIFDVEFENAKYSGYSIFRNKEYGLENMRQPIYTFFFYFSEMWKRLRWQ